MGYETELIELVGPSGKSFRAYEDANGDIQVKVNGTYVTDGNPVVTAGTDPVTGVITFQVGETEIPAPSHYSDFYVGAIVSGLALPTTGSLSNNIPSGVAYINDNRVPFAGQAITLPATKDTYIDISSSGVLTATSVTVGAAAPAIAANSLRVGYITTDATTVTGSTSNARDSLGNWMGNRVPARSCILRRYNNASLGGSVFSLSFTAGTEVIDNFTGHDGTGAPTRITIAKSGLYRVGFFASLASGTIDSVRLKVNGATDIRWPTMFFASGNLTPQGSFDCYLASGDYIEIQITPNGGSLPYAYYTYFSAVEIGL